MPSIFDSRFARRVATTLVAVQLALATLTAGTDHLADQNSVWPTLGAWSGTPSEPPERVTVPLPASPGPLAPFARLPLSFVRNEGQADPATRFEVRGRGFLMALQQTDAVMLLGVGEAGGERFGVRRPSAAFPPRATAAEGSTAATGIDSKAPEVRRTPVPVGESGPDFRLLRMRLVGAYPDAAITGEDELPGKFHYFIGNDPALWRTNVPSFAKVRYQEVYPGIDLLYYGNDGQLEYDFIVEPGADPALIELAIEGADSVEVDGHGDLRLKVAGRELTWRKPVIFQKRDGERIEVAGEYVLRPAQPDGGLPGVRNVAFRVGPYNRMLALVIDPVLAYSTYLGGSFLEVVSAMAVDSEGNAYVTGSTASSTASSSRFPTMTNSVQRSYSETAGGPAVFVTKLSPAGDRMIYSTVLAGKTRQDDRGYWAEASSIVIDTSGGATVAGTVGWTDFPTLNALQPSHGGGYNDGFVAKLSADGSALSFSTYLGGSESDSIGSLAADAQANLYVAGITRSVDFPVVRPLQATADSSFNPFVARIAADESRLDYSTYLSPVGPSDGYWVVLAVDPAGHAFVAGGTRTSQGADLVSLESDAFVQKLSPDGQTVEYSDTHVTGGAVSVQAIALGPEGSVFLGGSTYSKALPTTRGAFQTQPGGAPEGSLQENHDGFVARFNPATSTVEYLTYLGGSDWESVTCLAVDAAGNAHAGGWTGSTNFPLQDAIQSRLNQGLPASWYRDDAFVLKLTPNGQHLHWSTYLGGGKGPNWGDPGEDRATCLALGPEGSVYLGGRTDARDFPVMNALQRTLKNQPPYAAQDGFIAKIVEVPPTPPAVQITRSGSAVTISWPVSVTGFSLEFSDSVAPTPNWQPKPIAPQVVGDQNVVTLELGAGPRFFRLAKP